MPPLDGWRTLRRVNDDDLLLLLLEDVVVDVVMMDVFGTTGDGGRNAFVDCTIIAAAESSINDVVVLVMMDNVIEYFPSMDIVR